MNGLELVRGAICSLDGGYNGLDPAMLLGITEQSDGSIRYTLTDSDGAVQVFRVTVEAEL